MKAVIFAAGEGKRMRPLTLETPKPLLEVAGKPLLFYTFSALPDELTEVVVVVGYKKEQIQDYLGREFLGKKVTYVAQENIGGTAEALLLARPHLTNGEQFFTVCADDIYAKEDLEKLLEHELGMLLTTAEDPTRFGVVELDESGRVVSIEEKPKVPKSNLISTGVFLLDDRVFTYEAPLHESGERFLPSMVTSMIKDHPLVGVESTRWLQIGYPEDLARAEEVLQRTELSVLAL